MTVWGQKVKGQDHAGIQYAENSIFSFHVLWGLGGGIYYARRPGVELYSSSFSAVLFVTDDGFLQRAARSSSESSVTCWLSAWRATTKRTACGRRSGRSTRTEAAKSRRKNFET